MSRSIRAGTRWRGPWGGFSVLLNGLPEIIGDAPTTLESDRPAIGSDGRHSASAFEASGALSPFREKASAARDLPPVRTHNRIRSPR